VGGTPPPGDGEAHSGGPRRGKNTQELRVSQCGGAAILSAQNSGDGALGSKKGGKEGKANVISIRVISSSTRGKTN